VIIGAAIFGAVATIVIHWLWFRPSNSVSAAATRAHPAVESSEKQHRRLSASLQNRFG